MTLKGPTRLTVTTLTNASKSCGSPPRPPGRRGPPVAAPGGARGPADAGAAEGDAQRPVLAGRLLDRRLHRRGVGHVRADERGVPAELIGECLPALLLEVEDRHRSASGGQFTDGGL